MDDAEHAIRSQVAARSKLRADAMLPPLDEEAEVAMETALARRRAYQSMEDQHDADWLRIKAEVYAEERAKRSGQNWPGSSGGHMLCHIIARRRFQAFLAELGVEHVTYPVRNGVTCGSDRAG